jgi:dTDP-4-amino-4,6-dideoxygalactose transaminase
MGTDGMKDLAIFGATPAFAEPRHVGKPNVIGQDRFVERAVDILNRGWLTNNGPTVIEFERRLAEFLEVKHCVVTTNATIALEIAAHAMGLSGEVIVPSFTFVATAHALKWLNITPVFCDVHPDTHTLDPEQVEGLITPRTTGILGVHVWGRSCAVEALSEIADRHHLRLFYDAAHAFACTHRGKWIGGFGELEVFSFHATKFLHSFEGGAIATNNDEWAAMAQGMRNFGFSGYDQVDYLGTNGKMSEICAAMGLTVLDHLDQVVAANVRNYRSYEQQLQGIPGIELVRYDAGERNNFQFVVVEVDPERAGISRDQLVEILHAENVLARRYFFPGCHRMEPYASLLRESSRRLPHTDRLVERVMALPTGLRVGAADVAIIGRLLRVCVENADALREKLASAKASGLVRPLPVG